MAHDINYANGKHSFFSLKEVAWHGLGQVVPDALTSEEAIKEAGLDYDVHKVPVYADFRELPGASNAIADLKRGAAVPNYYATVRQDTRDILGLVGNRYEIIQNTQAFDFIDNIIGSKQAVFETAGALGKGERIFVTAKLPSVIRVGNTDDIIEEYFLFTSSHDASIPVTAGLTPVRVVCNNTLNMALKGLRNKVTIRHTKSAHEKIEMAMELMGMRRLYNAEFSEVVNKLARRSVSAEIVEDVIQQVVFTPAELKIVRLDTPYSNELSTRKKNVYSDILTHVDQGVGQDLHRGTAFWLYNGVSTYYNNGKSYKSNQERFDNLNDGLAYKNTQRAFDLVTELI